jgi:hypothetical protein
MSGVLTTLHTFDGTTAAFPTGTPIFGSDGKLYGTADQMAIWRLSLPPSPLQQWKLTHLGDANAPDLGDPDGDGVATLAEYGICALPQTANAAPHPAERFAYAEGERLRLFLQRDPEHNDVTVVVESTDSLSGVWSPVATSTLEHFALFHSRFLRESTLCQV